MVGFAASFIFSLLIFNVHQTIPTQSIAINTTITTSSDHPCLAEDCRGLIRVLCNGTIERSPDPDFHIPVLHDDSVEWKEVQFDPTHGLKLRLYKPAKLATEASSAKLPIVVYLHGGGFCFAHCYWNPQHNCAVRMASRLKAVVVSPDYRLAPENRLPAAFEDALSSLRWLRAAASGDEWIAGAADFGNVVILGDSSGGTIAHHLAVRLGSAGARAELEPVRVRKYVLLGPFFGGVKYTKSEEDCPKDKILNLELCDQFWRLALPAGADRDHPFSNPFGPNSGSLGPVEFEPTLVAVSGRDLLRDREVDYAERLKEMGKPVQLIEYEGEEHGFFTDRPESEAAREFMAALKKFIAEG